MKILYLDETFYTKNDAQLLFLGGVIIDRKDIKHVRRTVGYLKDDLFTMSPEPRKIVLHEAEAQRAYYNNQWKNSSPEYCVFQDENIFNAMYQGVEDIFDSGEISTLGCIYDSGIEAIYSEKDFGFRSKYLTAFYNVLDLFTQYLIIENDVGMIIAESRSSNKNKKSDQTVRSFYYQLLAHGTYKFMPQTIQARLRGIQFLRKYRNDALLQLADFVGGPICRNYLGEALPKPNVWQSLRKTRYGYEMDEPNTIKNYGIRIIR